MYLEDINILILRLDGSAIHLPPRRVQHTKAAARREAERRDYYSSGGDIHGKESRKHLK